jgi:hypothetical protein
MELSLIQARSTAVKKIADSVAEFDTYIRNNREFIPNFGERRRQGNDQYGFRGVDDQSGGEQTVCQEATDGMDAARCSPPAADPDQGPERRTGRGVPPVVPEIQVSTTNAGTREKGGVTPTF